MIHQAFYHRLNGLIGRLIRHVLPRQVNVIWRFGTIVS